MSEAIMRRPDETQADVVDRLPQHLRELVHEYGLSVVVAFYQQGVTRPASIRYLIQTVHLGAREPGNQKQTIKTAGRSVLSHVDAFLTRAGVGIPARSVIRAMRDVNWTAVSTSPTDVMVAASMATVSSGDVRCTKEEKHFRRLQAALNAGDVENWGPK